MPAAGRQPRSSSIVQRPALPSSVRCRGKQRPCPTMRAMTTLLISDLHLDSSRPAITALFLAFLRDEARFENLADLIHQIEVDKAEARRILTDGPYA